MTVKAKGLAAVLLTNDVAFPTYDSKGMFPGSKFTFPGREVEVGNLGLGGLREPAEILNLLSSMSACMMTEPRFPVDLTIATFLIRSAI